MSVYHNDKDLIGIKIGQYDPYFKWVPSDWDHGQISRAVDNDNGFQDTKWGYADAGFARESGITNFYVRD